MNYKKLIIILILAINISTLVSCSNKTPIKDERLLGRWSYDATRGGEEDFQCDIEFFNDGTFIIYPDYTTLINTFEYTILDDGRIKITSNQLSFVFNYDIVGDELKLIFDDGYNLYLKENHQIINQSTHTPVESTQIPTENKSNIFTLDWQINTGDLQYFGVDSDGIIYAASENLYAKISKDGEILETHEVDLHDCLRPGTAGGSGNIDILKWFYMNPEGIISSFAYYAGKGPCIIYPDGPRIEKLDNSYTMMPFSDDNLPKIFSEIPNGYKSLQSISSLNNWRIGKKFFWLDERRDKFQFFINEDQNKGAFINHNGNITDFTFEEDIEDLFEGHVKFLITPWDDLYYKYSTFDEIGNNTGDVIVKITPEGYREAISEIPVQLVEDFEPACLLINQKELFYFFGSERVSLIRSDKNFDVIGRYQLPEEFRKRFLGSTSVFVGNDLSVYLFDSSKNLLEKYSCPDILDT